MSWADFSQGIGIIKAGMRLDGMDDSMDALQPIENKRKRREEHALLHAKYKRNRINEIQTGGESGIRTHDTGKGIHAFQACAFSHSAISPRKRHSHYSGCRILSSVSDRLPRFPFVDFTCPADAVTITR